MKCCYLFDIDGTLADIRHRLHHIEKTPKDWDAFFAACGDDKPFEHICELAGHLVRTNSVVFVTGRSEQVRAETEQWLSDHIALHLPFPLYMRKAGDHRPDHVVKAELLDAIRADGYEPIMAFDDRSVVVEMWRANGIPCAQVADGNF